MVAFNDPMQWGEETAPSADGRLSKWKSFMFEIYWVTHDF